MCVQRKEVHHGSPKSPSPEYAMFRNIWVQCLLFSRGKEPEFPCVVEPWKFFIEGSQGRD